MQKSEDAGGGLSTPPEIQASIRKQQYIDSILSQANYLKDHMNQQPNVSDIKLMFKDSFYITVFQTLFQQIIPQLSDLQSAFTRDGIIRNIQYLIELTHGLLRQMGIDIQSLEIIKSIRAEQICGGNLVVIHNFLQIICELHKLLYSSESDNEDNQQQQNQQLRPKASRHHHHLHHHHLHHPHHHHHHHPHHHHHHHYEEDNQENIDEQQHQLILNQRGVVSGGGNDSESYPNFTDCQQNFEYQSLHRQDHLQRKFIPGSQYGGSGSGGNYIIPDDKQKSRGGIDEEESKINQSLPFGSSQSARIFHSQQQQLQHQQQLYQRQIHNNRMENNKDDQDDQQKTEQKVGGNNDDDNQRAQQQQQQYYHHHHSSASPTKYFQQQHQLQQENIESPNFGRNYPQQQDILDCQLEEDDDDDDDEQEDDETSQLKGEQQQQQNQQDSSHLRTLTEKMSNYRQDLHNAKKIDNSSQNDVAREAQAYHHHNHNHHHHHPSSQYHEQKKQVYSNSDQDLFTRYQRRQGDEIQGREELEEDEEEYLTPSGHHHHRHHQFEEQFFNQNDDIPGNVQHSFPNVDGVSQIQQYPSNQHQLHGIDQQQQAQKMTFGFNSEQHGVDSYHSKQQQQQYEQQNQKIRYHQHMMMVKNNQANQFDDNQNADQDNMQMMMHKKQQQQLPQAEQQQKEILVRPSRHMFQKKVTTEESKKIKKKRPQSSRSKIYPYVKQEQEFQKIRSNYKELFQRRPSSARVNNNKKKGDTQINKKPYTMKSAVPQSQYQSGKKMIISTLGSLKKQKNQKKFIQKVQDQQDNLKNRRGSEFVKRRQSQYYDDILKRQAQQDIEKIYTQFNKEMKNNLKNMRKIANVSSPRKKDLSVHLKGQIVRQKEVLKELFKDWQEEQIRSQQLNNQFDQIERGEILPCGPSAEEVGRFIRQREAEQRQFREQIQRNQKSRKLRKQSQQFVVCRKIYKLAAELQKYKLLQQRQQYIEQSKQKQQKQNDKLAEIQNFYLNQIVMLKQKIDQEKFKQKISKYAQNKMISQIRKQMRVERRKYARQLKDRLNNIERAKDEQLMERLSSGILK